MPGFPSCIGGFQRDSFISQSIYYIQREAPWVGGWKKEQIRRLHIRFKEGINGIWFLLNAFWIPIKKPAYELWGRPNPGIFQIGLPACPAHHMPNPHLPPLCGWLPVSAGQQWEQVLVDKEHEQKVGQGVWDSENCIATIRKTKETE